jgi:hypothetical protein
VIRYLVAFLAILALAACGPQPLPRIMPEPSQLTNYRVGEVRRVAVGEAIFDVQAAARVPTYVVAVDFRTPRPPVMGMPRELRRGMVFRASRSTPEGGFVLTSEEYHPSLGFRINREGIVTRGFVDATGTSSRGAGGTWPAEPLFIESQGFEDQPRAFRAQIIYSGIDGNTIRAVYREFVNDFARPAFNQELQYDLRESRTIAYKSMRIEVIRAGNAEIEYRVLEDGGLPWLPRNQPRLVYD